MPILSLLCTAKMDSPLVCCQCKGQKVTCWQQHCAAYITVETGNQLGRSDNEDGLKQGSGRAGGGLGWVAAEILAAETSARSWNLCSGQ